MQRKDIIPGAQYASTESRDWDGSGTWSRVPSRVAVISKENWYSTYSDRRDADEPLEGVAYEGQPVVGKATRTGRGFYGEKPGVLVINLDPKTGEPTKRDAQGRIVAFVVPASHIKAGWAEAQATITANRKARDERDAASRRAAREVAERVQRAGRQASDLLGREVVVGESGSTRVSLGVADLEALLNLLAVRSA